VQAKDPEHLGSRWTQTGDDYRGKEGFRLIAATVSTGASDIICIPFLSFSSITCTVRNGQMVSVALSMAWLLVSAAWLFHGSVTRCPSCRRTVRSGPGKSVFIPSGS